MVAWKLVNPRKSQWAGAGDQLHDLWYWRILRRLALGWLRAIRAGCHALNLQANTDEQ